MVEGTSSQGGRRENECWEKGEAPYKTIRSCENSFTITRTARGKSTPVIQSPPTRFLPQHGGLQFNMRFGQGHKSKPYQEVTISILPYLLSYNLLAIPFSFLVSLFDKKVFKIFVQVIRKKIFAIANINGTIHVI